MESCVSLLLEGRAALSASFATYKFVVAYGQIVTVSSVAMYYLYVEQAFYTSAARTDDCNGERICFSVFFDLRCHCNLNFRFLGSRHLRQFASCARAAFLSSFVSNSMWVWIVADTAIIVSFAYTLSLGRPRQALSPHRYAGSMIMSSHRGVES